LAGITLCAGWGRIARYAARRIGVRPRGLARRGGRAGAQQRAVYWNTSSGHGVSASKLRAARNSGNQRVYKNSLLQDYFVTGTFNITLMVGVIFSCLPSSRKHARSPHRLQLVGQSSKRWPVL